jgi:hypothetical protein
VPFQNVSDGAASEFVSQIRQCALDSTMPPGPVLSRHLDDQLLDLDSRAGVPGRAFSTPVEFRAKVAAKYVEALTLHLVNGGGQKRLRARTIQVAPGPRRVSRNPQA